MVGSPGTEGAARLSLAIVDQLLRTLVAKGTLAQTEVDGILEACAKSLEGEKTLAGERAAAFVRQWMIPK